MAVFNCQRSLGHAEQHNIVRYWGNIDRVSFALGYCLKIGVRFWRKQGNISLSTLSLNNEVLLFSLKTNRHRPLWLAAVLTKAVLKCSSSNYVEFLTLSAPWEVCLFGSCVLLRQQVLPCPKHHSCSCRCRPSVYAKKEKRICMFIALPYKGCIGVLAQFINWHIKWGMRSRFDITRYPLMC